MTLSSVTIQITPESKPSLPSWMGEVVAFAQVLTQEGILKAIQNQVRFARARFGHYDVIDFIDVGGTRQAPRQRALPQTKALPPPHRRLGSGVRAGLSRAQTRRSRTHPHRHPPGTYAISF